MANTEHLLLYGWLANLCDLVWRANPTKQTQATSFVVISNLIPSPTDNRVPPVVSLHPISCQYYICGATSDRLNVYRSVFRTWRRDRQSNHDVLLFYILDATFLWHSVHDWIIMYVCTCRVSMSACTVSMLGSFMNMLSSRVYMSHTTWTE